MTTRRVGPTPELESGSRPWIDRLGHPALGNLVGVMAVVVTTAAGLGLLRREIFWLVASYVVLGGALLMSVALARRRGRALQRLLRQRATSDERRRDSPHSDSP